MPPNCSRHLGNCRSSACCRRRPRPAARIMARIEILQIIRIREFYTAAASAREERCRYKQPGKPSKNSRARLASDRASAASGGKPDQRREQQVAALLHAQRAGNRESGAADGLSQAFEQQRIEPADRMMNQLQDQIDLAGTHEPAHRAQQKAGRHRSALGRRSAARRRRWLRPGSSIATSRACRQIARRCA